MLNKLKIIFWMIKNGYYLHLFYSIIFFLKKSFNKKVSFKERFSSKEAEKLCKKYLIKHKDLYFFFSKKKNYKITKPSFNIKKIKKKMGGGSDTILIYNLVIILKPKKIIEFGVANGWSSLAILLACKRNKFGKLISIDMPYYFNNAKKFIGNLIDKKNFPDWTLLLGPQVNYIKKIEFQKYDLCHYDSDKSYQGRMIIYSKIWQRLNKKGVLLSDDISDNLAFFDFCKIQRKKPYVLKFKQKYLGLIIK